MGHTTETDTRPNIVVVIVDDLGYGDVGWNAEEMALATPEIMDLAHAGVILDTFYTLPLCSPSRSAFFTGKYPANHGMQDFQIWQTEPRGVPLDQIFLSEKLRGVGYKTGLAGKWHVGFFEDEYTPLQRGFDKFFGTYLSSGDSYQHLSFSDSYLLDADTGVVDSHRFEGYNLRDGVKPTLPADASSAPPRRDDVFQAKWHETGSGTTRDGILLSSSSRGSSSAQDDEAHDQDVHITEIYTDQLLTQIEEFRDNPFFLVLAYQAVHWPVQADARFFDQCSGVDTPSEYADEYENFLDYRRIMCGMMGGVDEGMRRIRETLEEMELWDSTVLFFFSDNGGQNIRGSSNLPLRGEKDQYYEGGIRTPAFVGGGYLEQALADNGVTPYTQTGIHHVTDLHATILGLAGRATEEGIDGLDQWDAWLSGEVESTVRTEVLLNAASEAYLNVGGLRSGKYKLAVNPDLYSVTVFHSVMEEIAQVGEQLSADEIMSIANAAASTGGPDGSSALAWKLFDLSLNPTEREDGDCTPSAACSDLFDDPDFADVKTELVSKYNEYLAGASPSTSEFKDDGPFADPLLFQQQWTPWRRSTTDGEPAEEAEEDNAADSSLLGSSWSQKYLGAIKAPAELLAHQSIVPSGWTDEDWLLSGVAIGTGGDLSAGLLPGDVGFVSEEAEERAPLHSSATSANNRWESIQQHSRSDPTVLSGSSPDRADSLSRFATGLLGAFVIAGFAIGMRERRVRSERRQRRARELQLPTVPGAMPRSQLI